MDPQSENWRHLTSLLVPLHPDPQDLARRLLRRFGSLAALTAASDEAVRSSALDGEAWPEAFLCIRKLMQEGMRERVLRSPLTKARAELEKYLIMAIGALRHERMVVFFGDTQGNLISEDVLAEGSDANLSISTRALAARAMCLDARYIVLAHNHPSGIAEPSAADIETTVAIATLCRQLGIVLLDHLIVTRTETASCADRGLL
ncbi:JAB domain-containing protein [Qipengyuania sp. G39]|uniref:JAB domain-containing protein n=1 Tax=Qipengyuania profundimaris TaxID=3067652 RepID=A0ABT9HLT3_9SPHN|nr:JAB domain-containing protein [Qipengyuania sp. G39]MDP4574116.1 JAB domain-containing protein [Qipengyuania sp. G39]